jgi:hypothetical protein
LASGQRFAKGFLPLFRRISRWVEWRLLTSLQSLLSSVTGSRNHPPIRHAVDSFSRNRDDLGVVQEAIQDGRGAGNVADQLDLPLCLVERSESFQRQGQQRGTFFCEGLSHLALGGAVDARVGVAAFPVGEESVLRFVAGELAPL